MREIDGEIVCRVFDCGFKKDAKIPLEWATHQSRKSKVAAETIAIAEILDHHHGETAIINTVDDSEFPGHSSFNVFLSGLENSIGRIEGHRRAWEFEPRHWQMILDKIRGDFDGEMKKHSEEGYYHDFRD